MTEAIILCGGEGLRLKSNGILTPKPLLSLNNGNILKYQINWLKANDIEDIVIATSEQIYDENKKEMPLGVKYSLEKSKLGTGGALLQALQYIKEYPVYVQNVDDFIFSDTYSPLMLIQNLKESYYKGNLLLSNPPLPFSTINRNGSYVKGFERNPTVREVVVSVGHYAFSERIKQYLPEIGDMEITTLPTMADEGLLMCQMLKGEWKTVNDIKQYQQLLDHMRKL